MKSLVLYIQEANGKTYAKELFAFLQAKPSLNKAIEKCKNDQHLSDDEHAYLISTFLPTDEIMLKLKDKISGPERIEKIFKDNYYSLVDAEDIEKPAT